MDHNGWPDAEYIEFARYFTLACGAKFSFDGKATNNTLGSPHRDGPKLSFD